MKMRFFLALPADSGDSGHRSHRDSILIIPAETFVDILGFDGGQSRQRRH